MVKIKTFESELSYFMRICSAREYCDSDIRRKCLTRELDPKQVEDVLNYLHKENFLSEERYACAFARDKSQISGWGATKISYHLRMKGLSKEIINIALAQCDSTSTKKRMEQVLSLKWKSLEREQDPRKRKEKLLRYALGRGYSYEEALGFLSSL